eukprot:2525357-Pyramimonas_sp.AAC.1
MALCVWHGGSIMATAGFSFLKRCLAANLTPPSLNSHPVSKSQPPRHPILPFWTSGPIRGGEYTSTKALSAHCRLLEASSLSDFGV